MSYFWIQNYFTFDKKLNGIQPTSLHMKWTPPNTGWIKLDSDEVVSLDGNQATIGGVFRDSSAGWLWGYNTVLGVTRFLK